MPFRIIRKILVIKGGMTIPNRRSWSTQQHIIWMTAGGILRDYGGVLFLGTGINFTPFTSILGKVSPSNRPKTLVVEMIPVTEAVVQSPQFTVHIIMLFFWTGFSVLMNMHVFFLRKKTCCQIYCCDTLWQTNIAGWNMDPDWRCISYWTLGIFQQSLC